MAEDTDPEPTLDNQEVIIQSLRDHINHRVDEARNEGESSGYLNAVFHVAQMLATLVDPLGYKLVLVRKDEAESEKKESNTSAPKPAVKKTRRRKATKKLPLKTKLLDLPDVKPRIVNMLSLEGKRTISDVVELSTEYLRSLERVGPQAVKSLDDALAKAGYTRPHG